MRRTAGGGWGRKERALCQHSRRRSRGETRRSSMRIPAAARTKPVVEYIGQLSHFHPVVPRFQARTKPGKASERYFSSIDPKCKLAGILRPLYRCLISGSPPAAPPIPWGSEGRRGGSNDRSSRGYPRDSGANGKPCGSRRAPIAPGKRRQNCPSRKQIDPRNNGGESNNNRAPNQTKPGERLHGSGVSFQPRRQTGCDHRLKEGDATAGRVGGARWVPARRIQ